MRALANFVQRLSFVALAGLVLSATAAAQTGLATVTGIVSEVVAANTLHAAKAIKQEQLGNLSVGSGADVAVLRVEKGNFGFLDQAGARFKGTQRLICELTLRDGKVVYDLNGLEGVDWDKLPKDHRGTSEPRGDANPAAAPRARPPQRH